VFLNGKKILMLAPSLLAMVAVAQSALANEVSPKKQAQLPEKELLHQINQYNQSGKDLNQVESVFELRDISPDDWAFQALQNLVETYGCPAGYPDGTFRGNQTLTRYEFAAGLKACLAQLERLLAQKGTNAIAEQDLESLQRLVKQFQTELSDLGVRLDNLTGRVSLLEETQFSTTTKLTGNVVFDVAVADGQQKAEPAQADFGSNLAEVDDSFHFTHRVRTQFNTSFTGRDSLRVRLQEGNNFTLRNATGVAAATRNLVGDTGGDVDLNQLIYSFPIGDHAIAHVGAEGMLVDNVFYAGPTAGFAYNSINLFSTYNNLIYDVSSAGGAGFGVNWFLDDSIQLDLGYFTPSGVSRNPEQGLFGGSYSTGGQLGVDLGDVNLSFAYLRSFQSGGFSDLSGFVGSPAARFPFGGGSATNRANTADHFGVQGNWRVTPNFHLGGYFGYVNATTKAGPDSEADILNWLVNASFPDLGKEGSVLIVGFGQPPKLVDASGGAIESDPDTGYLLDLEYHYPINDHISIASGGYALFNPNHNAANDTIVVGRIRTLFSF